MKQAEAEYKAALAGQVRLEPELTLQEKLAAIDEQSTFGNVVIRVWDGLGEALPKVGEGLVDAVPKISAGLSSLPDKTWASLVKHYDRLSNLDYDLWENFWRGVGFGFTAAFYVVAETSLMVAQDVFKAAAGSILVGVTSKVVMKFPSLGETPIKFAGIAGDSIAFFEYFGKHFAPEKYFGAQILDMRARADRVGHNIKKIREMYYGDKAN